MRRMNVMLTSTGRRGYSVENFKEAVGDQSLVFACDSSSDASALQKADKAFIVPRVDQEDYVDTLLAISKAIMSALSSSAKSVCVQATPTKLLP